MLPQRSTDWSHLAHSATTALFTCMSSQASRKRPRNRALG
jgi:hypothetical protein